MPQNPYNEPPTTLGKILNLVYGIVNRPYDSVEALWTKVARSLGVNIAADDELETILSRIVDAGGSPPAPPAPPVPPVPPEEPQISWEPSNLDANSMLGLFAFNNSEALVGITSLTINHTTNREGYDIFNALDVQTLSFPNLVSITDNGYLSLIDFPSLLSLSLPNLETVLQSIALNSLAITSLDLSALVSVDDFDFNDCDALVAFELPSLESSSTLFRVRNSNALESISLPSMTFGADMIIENNFALTTWSSPLLAEVSVGLRFTATAIATLSLPALGSASITINSNGPLTSLSLPALVTADLQVTTNGSLAAVSAPVLETAGLIRFVTNNNLLSLSFPSLTDLTEILIDSNTDLTSVSLDALINYGPEEFAIFNNQLLTTISVPSLVFSNTVLSYVFANNALSAATVNAILARAVANPAYTSGVLQLQGGTNAAPSGQGIVDKATLQGRGVTVLTN